MKKVRILLTGVGNRSLPKDVEKSNWDGWVKLILQSPHFELVGAHDVSQESLDRLTARGHLPSDATFTDFSKMLKHVKADAILITNPAQYHAGAIKESLEKDLHCLVEKPFVDDISTGFPLLELAKSKNKIVSIVQNWRCKDVGQELYRSIHDNKLGKIGYVMFRYIRDRENPKYPKYIFEEKYPLIYAMMVHHLDLLRYVLQDDFVTVQGSSFKPSWSLYNSVTGHNFFLKTRSGVSAIYSGTFSSRSRLFPQESLLIEGEKGILYNDSDWSEPPLWFVATGSKEKIDLTAHQSERTMRGQYDIADKKILENFYQSIVGKESPICAAHDAIRSIATLEACRRACETGETISVDDFIK